MLRNLLILLCAVLLFASGVLVERGMRQRDDGGSGEPARDTVVLRDTLTVIKPQPVASAVVDSLEAVIAMRDVTIRRLSGAVAVADTVLVRSTDTVVVHLPRTVREYRDSAYHVVISGYEPTLDRIDVFGATTVIRETKIVDYSRWGVGVWGGVGVAAMRDGRIVGAPAVGIGVTYDLIRFRSRR